MTLYCEHFILSYYHMLSRLRTVVHHLNHAKMSTASNNTNVAVSIASLLSDSVQSDTILSAALFLPFIRTTHRKDRTNLLVRAQQYCQLSDAIF